MEEVKLSRIFVVEERSNPSTDFFITPRLQRSETEIEHCNLQQPPQLVAGEQVAVVFVRYVSKTWQRWVQQHRNQIRRLIYFMDDDLFDASAFRGLPWRYRYKLSRLALSRRSWLQNNQAELWVSTPYLQNKYQQWQPSLVQACSPGTVSSQLTLFYHGSASHQAEIEWLYPVVASVLESEADISFEIIGNGDINWKYRGLPRVHVLHPMSWPAYQALLARGTRDIGLAPLLDQHFNQARSYTKFFDITRAGGVGIYTEGSIYGDVVEHQSNGLLLPNEQQQWADAIVNLVRQPELRLAMQRNAQQSSQCLRGSVWDE